jgi:hypothetical protein
MAPERNPRQIRYKKITNTDYQTQWRYNWMFFILNSRRECKAIEDKLITAMAMCDNVVELESGILVPKSSLVGKLITLDTNVGELPPKRTIYDTPKWYHDRNLRSMNDVELQRYAEKCAVS